MQKYGYNGVLYIIANWTGGFENKNLINFNQARKMQGAGWEIGSHSLDHMSLTHLSEDNIKKELEGSKKLLEDNGLDVESFSYPYGSFNSSIMMDTEKYYLSARSFDEGFNYFDSLGIYSLKTKVVSAYTPYQAVCGWMNQAIKDKFWLILTFHDIDTSRPSTWTISESKFNEILKCINETKIQVKTIKEVLDNL